MSLDVPLIEVNHLQAHILAHFIEDANPMPPTFPFLCLTVSGGHTMIVVVKDYFDMEIIGKQPMMLPVKLSIKSERFSTWIILRDPSLTGLLKKFNKPKLDNYDYSFSGIKTSVFAEKHHRNPDEQTGKSGERFKYNEVAIAGGVLPIRH
ncbi:hypothetical protein IEQ34_025541 [Dendrobium chrysotoxum]|uniref:Gcp-like domain-containing protein n=1 Tax=Dendrobium chrysotoxum TaxID=161865 RepID=A0AAV7FPK7_DENCH|nr:hypothetical protein IEQ34_025541 [Dendrobium chrysotoxum]